ncbi:MAG: metallophosphoesterase [Bacteroidales bacterium]|nr:metallophosphoesterase [Bacteroidales bacterium]
MNILIRIIFLVFCLAPWNKALLMAQFRHDIRTITKPWTAAPVVHGNNFRFIVTGDITGGEEPGVLEYAIKRINELSPDFVITVGDLIDGYTYDSIRIEKQWDSFMSTLGVLEMPFFFTAGNHDITNQLMKDIWTKRFGPEYYSFSVGKALFLVLNISEAGTHNFSEAQYSFVWQEVKKHPENDPVFVIQHYPLWKIQNNNNINNLLTLLKNRNAYWFCGHEHRFMHKTINNQPHYMLAGLATGGPGMQGIAFGEYHNMMQVSVREQDIKIANLDLAGMLPLNIVDETTEKQVNTLRSGNWAQLTPVFLLTDSANELHTSILLNNTSDFPFEISSAFEKNMNFAINPPYIKQLLHPNERLTIPVVVSFDTKVKVWEIPEIKLSLNVQCMQPGHNLHGSVTKKLTVDYLRKCSEKTQLPESLYPVQIPAYVDEAWDWNGLHDSGFELKTHHDNKNLFIEISVTDDILLTAINNQQADKLSVWFASDTALQTPDYLKFDFVAGLTQAEITQNSKMYKNIQTESKINKNKLIAKVTIPLKLIKCNYFRINLAYHDVDDPVNMDHATLWWKPYWSSSDDYNGAGLFILE